MEGISLFKIVDGNNIVDYTNYITVPSYKVNNKPFYTEWTDGDLNIHRDIQRYYLEGSFTLYFTDPEEYQAFLSRYKRVMVDGHIPAYVYSNNDHELKLANIFMDFELENEMPFMGAKEIEGFEVTIREV